MRTSTLAQKIRSASGATLLVALLPALLASCAKPAPPPPPPAEVPAAPAVPDAIPDSIPPDTTPPDAAPPPAPTPDVPPPSEPTTVPKPAASQEPDVNSMLAANPGRKMSVAVDLRYSFEGAVLPNQPVVLHLAAIPRGSGVNVAVSVQEAPGLEFAAGPLNVQKAGASNIYRQQVSLTKLSATAQPLRVLVRMEMGKNSGFGYFTIPLDGVPDDAGTIPQKQDSVKQR